jgi:hypothetical protein
VRSVPSLYKPQLECLQQFDFDFDFEFDNSSFVAEFAEREFCNGQFVMSLK